MRYTASSSCALRAPRLAAVTDATASLWRNPGRLKTGRAWRKQGRAKVNDDRLAELVEINLLFAKSELCGMADSSAPARALAHIEKALKDLYAGRRQKAKPKNEAAA
jgi:hypothetical protein